jgi:hypothetical protein
MTMKALPCPSSPAPKPGGVPAFVVWFVVLA